MSSILVIDKDPLQLALTARLLRRENHEVHTIADPERALEFIKREVADMAILEPAMDRHDGYRFGQRLRELRPMLPVLVISEHAEEEQIVSSLRAFADDYLVKPCSPRQLLARVHVLFRRAARARGARAADGSLVAGKISLNLHRQQASVDGLPVALTPRELALLAAFMSNPDRVLSREDLIPLAWSGFDGGTKTVDVCIGRLRRKIEAGLGGDRFIEAVRGFGYRLATSGMSEQPDL